MRAAILEGWGGVDQLRVGDWPRPSLRRDEVLVEVHAASLNPRDWMIREGRYPFQPFVPRPPLILGSDVSGVVVELGKNVTSFALGQPVFGMQPTSRGFGAHAELVAIPATALAPKPATVDHQHAAGVPLAALTALQALREQARLTAGQHVLVVGASGGVGSYAVQIARCLGARVTAVASGRNQDLVAELGAERVFDYEQVDPWAGASLEGGAPYGVVFDVIGRGSLARGRPVLAAGGTYVTTIPRRRQIVEWLVSRVMGPFRPAARRARVVMVRSDGRQLRELAGWMDEGKLRTVVDSVFPLAEIAKAHERSRTFRARGKILVTMR